MEYAEDKSAPQNSPHKKRLDDSIEFLLRYLKNPVQAMRQPPAWDWATILFFYCGVSAICGAAGGFVSRHVSQIITGLIFIPISATMGAFVATGFFYYTFAFFFKREILIKDLFTIVMMAVLPILVLSIFSSWLIPLNLISYLATGLLLVVGLTENTHVDRRKIMKLIGGIYFIYVAFWIFNSIHARTERDEYKNPTSDAVDILEREKSK